MHATRQPAPSQIGDLVVFDLVEQRAVADFEDLGGARAIAARLLQRTSNQDLFDDAGRLLDGQLAARQLHLHGVTRLADPFR